MPNLFKIFLWLFLPICLFSNLQTKSADINKTIAHKVTIKHPGDHLPLEVILNEVQNEQGIPMEYYMDVKSVICLEEVCKVISVRIFWNDVGVYQKYELEDGATLEKYEADLFEPADYKKLQTILLNYKSPFKEFHLEEILSVVVNDSTGDLDATSGATAIHLDEKDNVPGAALTCYTLWHWAHGDVVRIIKDMTASTLSDERISSFLNNENRVYFFVGIRALANRNIYTKPYMKIVVDNAINNDMILKASIRYISKAPPDLYFVSIEEIYLNGNTLQKERALWSLLNTKNTIDKDYLVSFSEDIKYSKSYQEVSLFLDLLQGKQINSEKIIENVISLLDGDFLIARRAYYHLNNQELNGKQKEHLDTFYNQYKNKL